MTKSSDLGGTNPQASQRVLKERQQLHDFILSAVHRACDTREFGAAKELLASAEAALKVRADMTEHKRRLALDAIVAAHERLLLLKLEAGLVMAHFQPQLPLDQAS